MYFVEIAAQPDHGGLREQAEILSRRLPESLLRRSQGGARVAGGARGFINVGETSRKFTMARAEFG